MPTENDNRMGWVRNYLKICEKPEAFEYWEYEIVSECRITGLLTYKDGLIICSLFMMEEDERGLFHYILKVKQAKSEVAYNSNASKKGYYYKKGAIGEIITLFSLFLRCRFYLIAFYYPEINGIKHKYEYKFNYRSCNPALHKGIFDVKGNPARNFCVGLPDFLDKFLKLPAKHHQKIIFSCAHYLNALKDVGIDEEMLYVRLVSAIEVLSSSSKLKDQLCNKVNKLVLDSKIKAEIINNLSISGTKKNFIKFIKDNCKYFFKGGGRKVKHCIILKPNLVEKLKVIYDARSEYLHNGEPMYISRPMHGDDKWDQDPTMGIVQDNRSIDGAKKLPFTNWFEKLVRHSILNYIDKYSS